MKRPISRLALSPAFVALLAAGWIVGSDAPSSAAPAAAAPAPSMDGVSGQGKYKFRVLYKSDHLPSEAQAVLEKAHGGFAVDHRDGRGETYFALPGAGIIQISADMKSTKMLATDAAMKDPNMHNTTIWYGKDGSPFLSFPGAGIATVFTTDLSGKLVHKFGAPDGTKDLGHPAANDYFIGRGNFVPTDLEQLNGMFYIATGYSNLDYVLTAKILSTNPFKTAWYDLAFGGKGDGVGQLGTGHGITVPPGTTRIDVADRPNSEIERYTRHGQYLSTLPLPLGSFPCDVDYVGKYGLVGALHGPDRKQGAPIYLLEDDKLVSTIMCKTDLGLENFQHIHNSVLREVGGKLYIIAQAWNPGDFAILEQVN